MMISEMQYYYYFTCSTKVGSAPRGTRERLLLRNVRAGGVPSGVLGLALGVVRGYFLKAYLTSAGYVIRVGHWLIRTNRHAAITGMGLFGVVSSDR